jgi:short-subunit dehydrogenase
MVRGHTRLRVDSPVHGISPERVAQAVLQGYLRRKREVVVPWRDRIFILLYQLCPRLVELGMARMVKAEPSERQATSGK